MEPRPAASLYPVSEIHHLEKLGFKLYVDLVLTLCEGLDFSI